MTMPQPPMQDPFAAPPSPAYPLPMAYPPYAGYAAPAQAINSSATNSSATNSSATIAFVLSLLGLVLTPVVDVAAVIVGHHALRTIRRTGEAGAGLAKAALGIGYSLIGIGTIVMAFLVAMIAGSTAN